MDPRQALSQLQDVLSAFEQTLFDGDTGDVDGLVEACQNFRATGQNFDDPVAGQGAGVSGLSGLVPADLEELEAQLSRIVAAVEMTRESIQGELGGITRGRRGLRGYQGMYTLSSAQYISTCH